MNQEGLSESNKVGLYGQRVYKYVEKNFDRELKLEDVATYFHLNKCYFCSVLKKELGKTFSQIVNEVRVEKSKELLREGNLSTLSIALSVGFNNQNYFNMTFKKLTGMTPLQYRKIAHLNEKEA
jgi:YesN/AraC family two-component response regulator